MQHTVRAIDVGYGNTKYVTAVGGDHLRCASFPSIAYASFRDRKLEPGAQRRQTAAVPIDGMFYEVGPEVELAADNFRPTQMHDRYVETPQYLALMRGALGFMNVKEIDLLVVGLPVSLLKAKKAALEKLATGEHDVGGGKRVIVHRALALAQPQGALLDFTMQHGKAATIESERSLVIDPGMRTFDWLVSDGMRLVQAKSHSVNRGVDDVLRAIAMEIGYEIGTPYEDLQAVDRALRLKKNITVYQRVYELARARRIADNVSRDAVNAMMRWLDASYTFQNIILIGGGASLFKNAVKQAFPTHRILETKDPLFSNVRGFQLAGISYMLRANDRTAATEAP